jgi:homospermidine synthase
LNLTLCDEAVLSSGSDEIKNSNLMYLNLSNTTDDLSLIYDCVNDSKVRHLTYPHLDFDNHKKTLIDPKDNTLYGLRGRQQIIEKSEQDEAESVVILKDLLGDNMKERNGKYEITDFDDNITIVDKITDLKSLDLTYNEKVKDLKFLANF